MHIHWSFHPERYDERSPQHAMQPLSLVDWVLFQIGLSASQAPVECQVCGTPSRGNRVTGYFLPCGGHED